MDLKGANEFCTRSTIDITSISF